MKINIKAILFVILLVGAGLASYMSYKHKGDTDMIACTMDAKMCPDGTYVGRTGPQCEFEACPGAGGMNGDLKTQVSEDSGLSFQYPENLGTKYISTTDWPPVLMLVNENFTCVETAGGAGMVTSREITVNGKVYCQHSISEGAAGSIYTGYIYSFPYGDQTAALTFSIRATQCANYDEAERVACERERETFNLDSVVDLMAGSIKVAQ